MLFVKIGFGSAEERSMYIGGGYEGLEWNTPEEWLETVKKHRYTAVLCPVDCGSGEDTRAEYRRLIDENGLKLGEVGVWKNTLDPDDAARKKNMDFAKGQLALADEMKAGCCVNIVGSRGKIWDGAYRDNYTADTYALIVDSVREIIDAVRPVNTYYTIEPMPWMVPDTPDAYLKLLKDVDRERFGVHLDYANMINTPYKYLHSREFITECFEKLGPCIKSIHAKDLFMDEYALPVVIREILPGKGTIDFRHVLRLADRLGPDMTVYTEHFSKSEEYMASMDYLLKAYADIQSDGAEM